MVATLVRLRAASSHAWLKWLAVGVALVAVVGTVLGDTAPPNIPLISLSAEPLYARGARAKPTLTLDLSVEFPTVGAQYLGTVSNVDSTYSSTNQYPGYFDIDSCYAYNNAPTETIPTGLTTADYKRFDRSGDVDRDGTGASLRTCGGRGFSGNFMNWASSSAIDILRYGLTGGDRVIDTSTLTVLQRAVLPNTNVSSNFWNGSNFPDKQLTNAQAVGALPTALLGTYTGTVHIANCLNRIHFGTTAGGSCSSPGTNSNLGTPQAAYGPKTTVNTALPSNFVYCADENGTCSFTGVKQVAYGADSGSTHNWYYMSVSNGIGCNNTVWGDPYSGVVKKCYMRADPTGWTAPPAALTSDTFFYTRVSVCGVSGGNLTDTRTSLCLRYPGGNYKPVGNMQKYSDRVRVAVFGYLNDATGNPNQRYGGVLRTPMKYVGPTYYDANFSLVSGANPNAEWDPTTGVLLANPDANSTVKSGPSYTGPYLSGAINYLNQFGRTGVFGQYKTYDPVSTLYYESLRYLQGLPPTCEATNSHSNCTANTSGTVTSGQLDGFPITTTWTDPHPAVAGSTDYSCVKNNIVTIGDIHTHNDGSVPGNAPSSAAYLASGTSNFSRAPGSTGAGPYTNNLPDFWYWMKVVGGFESGNAVSYVDGSGRTQSTTSPTNPTIISSLWGLENRTPDSDFDSYYMAGIAYWANTHDIRSSSWTNTALQRPGMRVTSYTLDVNEYGASSVASARHQNQFFLAAKYGGFDDVSGTGNPFKSANGTDNSDWSGTATGTEASNYFLSSSASAVLAALDTIFKKVTEQSNSIAGGSISTQTLSSVPGYIYQAQFDPASWSGDLLGYKVTTAADGTVTVGNSPTDNSAAWQASAALTAKASATSPAGSSRVIVVGKDHPTGAPAAMNFLWANLDTATKTALQTPPYTAAGTALDPESTGQARAAYLRGDRSNEAPSGLKFRTRNSILGDIINSGVTFSGAPSSQISDASYATFATTYANRKHALFVGANDGMLHAFDPDHGDGTVTGGDELFAYIPSWVVSRLANLTSSSYVHQSYVDATPAVAEAQVGTDWKTVLVSGSGGGGQGVFALDVSDPAAFDATKVMWEFTDADDADLGNVIGKPQILKVRTSALTAAATYKYFAVFASGINNYASDGHFSTTGAPAIFLLDLSKTPGTAWTLGTNYFKIGGSQSSATDMFAVVTTMKSGMVGFTAKLGDDGSLAQIYAGDLQGNMWKVDFTKATAGISDWKLSKLSYFADTSGAPLPLYIAKDGSGNRQPITMDPALVYGANRTIIVAFGTGKFLEVSDLTSSGQQSVYAVLDNNTPTLDTSTSPLSAVKGRTRMAAGTYTYNAATGTGTITTPTFVWGRPVVDNTDPLATTARSGWYFDYSTSGERQISDFTVLPGQLMFGSVIPPVSSCDNGNGNLYTVTMNTGGGSASLSSVGILGQPFIAQVGAASLTTSDPTGARIKTTTYQYIQQGAGGLIGGTASTITKINGLVGRLSWREVTNYKCVKNSTTGVC